MSRPFWSCLCSRSKAASHRESAWEELLISMFAASEVRTPTRNFRLRPIALPVEHGGWGLLLEPILLGLLLAPSMAGLFLSLAALSAFLFRHPLKIAFGDLRRNRQSARTHLVHTFTLIYGASAVLFLTVTVKLGGGKPLIPLLIAAPLISLQLSFDFRGRSRALIAELAGTIAAGSLATSLALSAGWTLKTALVLWVIVIARSAPTILYLRTRLRVLHGKSVSATPAIFAQMIAITVVLIMIKAGVAPVLALVAVLILFLRAVVGLSNFDGDVTPKKLGLCELLFGAITVFTVVSGYLFHF